MAKKSSDFSVIFSGKTPMRNSYTIKFVIKENRIETIDIMGRANLFIQETCESFARKKPANFEDVLSVIKLEMIKRAEFVSEVRHGA